MTKWRHTKKNEPDLLNDILNDPDLRPRILRALDSEGGLASLIMGAPKENPLTEERWQSLITHLANEEGRKAEVAFCRRFGVKHWSEVCP